jgi:branched-chain amino acid transport system permease protein
MQLLINGTILGLTISVLALAFTVVYLPTRVFHLALGAVYVAAPFIAWTLLQGRWGWPAAVAAACLAGVLLSLLCELINHSPLSRKGASPGAHLVSSLGIFILLVQVVSMYWGEETKVLRTGLDSVFELWRAAVTRVQFVAAVASVLLIALFFMWLRFTGLGLQFRALASNQAETALRGYNLRRLRLVAFGISGLLATASAILVSLDLGFNSQGGLTALFLAVVAVIVGGRETFAGPVVGGILLGMVRTLAVWFLSTRWQEGITFLLLALFLFVRPSGLFRQKRRIEAQA